MPFFRKKPVVVESVQYTGSNRAEIVAFANQACVEEGTPTYTKLRIITLEGPIDASPGDWVIKGVHGEFYPCKPDIFQKTYDPVVL